jgi:hypothetical protein
MPRVTLFKGQGYGGYTAFVIIVVEKPVLGTLILWHSGLPCVYTEQASHAAETGQVFLATSKLNLCSINWRKFSA